MKRYTRPQAEIIKIRISSIITASGEAPSNLINKGENGTPAKESFSSLFGA